MVKKATDFKTAKLYAKALYDSAKTAGTLLFVLHDVEALKSIELAKIPEAQYLNSPVVDFEQKNVLLEAIAKKLNLSEQSLNLLKILTQNNKFKLLDYVLDDFYAIYDSEHNIAEIIVETAAELSEKQNECLKEKLAKIFGKTIKINYLIKPEIIGGLVIKNGTTLIDLSLKNKLKNLEQLMKGTD